MAVDERSFRFWRANPKRKQRGERKPAQSYNTFARGESGGGKDKTRNNLSPNTIPGSKGDWAESYVQTPSPWQTYLLDTFSSTKSAQDSIEKQGELKVPRGTDLDLEMTDVELESQDSRPSKRAWPTFVWRGGRSDCAYIPLLCRASPASASTSASSPLGPRSKRAEEASVDRHEFEYDDGFRQRSSAGGRRHKARACKMLPWQLGSTAKQRLGMLVVIGLLISGVALVTATVLLAISSDAKNSDSSSPQPGTIINGTAPQRGTSGGAVVVGAAIGGDQPVSVMGFPL